MLAVTHYICPAILQPICYYKIYKILKIRNKIFSTDLDHKVKNKSKLKITPYSTKELNDIQGSTNLLLRVGKKRKKKKTSAQNQTQCALLTEKELATRNNKFCSSLPK